MPRASHGLRSGPRVRSSILVALSILLVGMTDLMAQEGRPASSIGEPSARSVTPENQGEGQGAGPGLVRVPRPSNHRYPFAPGADSSGLSPSSPVSTGWWLGSAGIALAMAVCGAVCVAARKYWPQDSSGLVHVVGRVSLSPKHSIYLVRAGQRILLIGTGAQGAPTLLGELGGDDQTEEPTGDARGRTAPYLVLPGRPPQASSQRTVPLVDVRLGEDE
jgi:flagellar protein FliO/FliZ